MPFLCDGADFDGTNDFMTRGAALDGDVDSKLFTAVYWVRKDGGDGATGSVLRGAHSDAGIRGITAVLTTANKIQFQGHNGSTGVLHVAGDSDVLAGAAWRCVLASFDMSDTGKRHVYLDDVAESLTVTTYTDSEITNTQAIRFGIGANINAATKLNGCLAEVMLWQGVYLDLSVEANRRLFIKANGKPEDPNLAGGAIATLGTPIIYQHLDDAEAVANFATNAGSGGDFTITGTLETADTSPSDGQEPVADFSGDPVSGTVPFTVTFTDLTTNEPTGWDWDFGDGATSTDQNPTHEYTVAGTYDVELTATSNAGTDAETKTAYITASAVATVTGGKGDNAPKRRRIVKPTGLTAPKRREKTPPAIEARIAETREIAKEVAREQAQKQTLTAPLIEISQADVDREIGVLLQKIMRTEDEEILLLTLMAAAAAA